VNSFALFWKSTIFTATNDSSPITASTDRHCCLTAGIPEQGDGGHYLGQRRSEKQEVGESCIKRSFPLLISPSTIRMNKVRGMRMVQRVRHMGKTNANRLLVEKTEGENTYK